MTDLRLFPRSELSILVVTAATAIFAAFQLGMDFLQSAIFWI